MTSKNEDLDTNTDQGANFFSQYLLLLLFVSNLNEAKNLWKRIPGRYKESSSPFAAMLISLWYIGSDLLNDEISKALQQIQKLSLPVESLQNLVKIWFENVLLKFLQDIGNLYRNVTVTLLVEKVKLTEEDVLRGNKNLSCQSFFLTFF
jgi:hypothetical protein